MNQRTISRMTVEGPRDSVLWGSCSVWAHVCVPAQSIFRNCLQGSEQKHKHLLKRRKYQKRVEPPALSHNFSQHRHTPLQKDGPSTLGRWASDLGKTEIPFSTVLCAGYSTFWENRFSSSSSLLRIHAVAAETNGSCPWPYSPQPQAERCARSKDWE